ncbi:hypothetical protein R1sor_012167 [Riccia sorocarpa]|uniref:AAA+ ATPase domain-containing protein n=1 Tax=Riccia sorocarpa TaxID=122646 RepID=A0ABD3I3W0_9MARC
MLTLKGKGVQKGVDLHIVTVELLGAAPPPDGALTATAPPQEVTSRKDQEQYWSDKTKPYTFVSVDEFAEAFNHHFEDGLRQKEELQTPYDKSKSPKNALATRRYSLSKWQLFKINYDKELLLMKRNRFFYVFRIFQFSVSGLLFLSAYFGTEMSKNDPEDGDQYAAALFFGVVMVTFNGYADLAMTAPRLPVFYKQRDLLFFPTWAFVLPRVILSIPVSFYEATILVALTYYPIGFAPAAKHWYWIGVRVLSGYSLLFNVLFSLALTYLNPLKENRSVRVNEENAEEEAAITRNGSERLSLAQRLSSSGQGNDRQNTSLINTRPAVLSLPRRSVSTTKESVATRGMVLPFQPLSISFSDVNYYVDMPPEMKQQGAEGDKLQLLKSISGAFWPGVLTALVGISGAGKTTLMDVLAGRKTGGYIEGDIRIAEETLTIAVELVANPSINFMDEPTSGLDARAAAIVMKTVRNTVDTGRTVICTIHQPSIEIFEAFDELLLLKRGGRRIYAGPLRRHSHKLRLSSP